MPEKRYMPDLGSTAPSRSELKRIYQDNIDQPHMSWIICARIDRGAIGGDPNRRSHDALSPFKPNQAYTPVCWPDFDTILHVKATTGDPRGEPYLGLLMEWMRDGLEGGYRFDPFLVNSSLLYRYVPRVLEYPIEYAESFVDFVCPRCGGIYAYGDPCCLHSDEVDVARAWGKSFVNLSAAARFAHISCQETDTYTSTKIPVPVV